MRIDEVPRCALTHVYLII